ncbi:hypothetical protein HIDPHFAB_01235 [Nocardioides sp. T2.26MG-1]|nr:hypothetical protein HIDPHFAB_01235 [Nocardioides sp. T2.26MG-1]
MDAAAARATGRSAMRELAPHSLDRKLPYARDFTLAEASVHPSIKDVRYVQRDVHDEALARLRKNKRLLIVGPAMAGKTRLGLELARTGLPKYRVWKPPNAEALFRAVSAGIAIQKTVIWLDDLENFSRIGSVSYLDGIVSDNFCIATIRSAELDRLTASDEGKPDGFDLVPWFGDPIWIGRWSVDELERATEQLTESETDRAKEYGLGAMLGGGPLLERRLRVAQSDRPLEYQIVRLTADWQSLGMRSGPPRPLLAQALSLYLKSTPTEPEIDEAMAWLTKKISRTVALVEEVSDESGTVLLANEYVEELLGEWDELRQVPEVWDVAFEIADSEELASLGTAAILDGSDTAEDRARRAWQASSHPLAKSGLASLLWSEGRLDEAEALLRPLAESEPIAAHHLAITLEKKAGGTDSYSEEAERLYRQAAEHNLPAAAFNAARSTLRSGRPNVEADVERYFRQAMRLGYPGAAGALGSYLVAVGRHGEALPLLEQAADSGDVDARMDLAQWHLNFGEVDEAVEVLGDASLGGIPRAISLSALALAVRGDQASVAEAIEQVRALLDDPEAEWEGEDSRDRVVERLVQLHLMGDDLASALGILTDHPDLPYANYWVGTYLVEHENADGGRKFLELAFDLGVKRAANQLGALAMLVDRDEVQAEAWLWNGALSDDLGSMSSLANLIWNRDDESLYREAEYWWEQALARAKIEHDADVSGASMANLAVVAEALGDPDKAMFMHLAAAKAGRVTAMNNLADMLMETGTVRGKIEARRWRRHARKALRTQPSAGHVISASNSAVIVMHDDRIEILQTHQSPEGPTITTFGINVDP